MIKRDQQSWNMGRAHAMRGMPSKCPKRFDELAYSSGYHRGRGVAGEALLTQAQASNRLRAVQRLLIAFPEAMARPYNEQKANR